MRHGMKGAWAALIAASVGLFIVAATCQAQSPIRPEQAAQHIGEDATVTGVVAQVFTSNKETTFLNFCAPYPRHCFHAVIYADEAAKFPGVHALEGKAVAVRGKIGLYEGKPEIVLSQPQQLQ